MLVLSVGPAGVFDDERSTRAGAEYRFGERGAWDLIPSLGVATSELGGNYVSTEVRRNFWVEDCLVLTPSTGLGYFEPNAKIDLGGELEFRSGLELTHCFRGDMRLGIALFHLSNAGIFDSNPGTETLVATLAIPLQRSR